MQYLTESTAKSIAERWGFVDGVSAIDVDMAPNIWIKFRIFVQRCRIAWYKAVELPKIDDERLRYYCDDWANYAEWQCQEAEAAMGGWFLHGYAEWRRRKSL